MPDETSDVDIDSMTDELFQDYIDALGDEEFDQLIQDWEVQDDGEFDDDVQSDDSVDANAGDVDADDDDSRTGDDSWAEYDLDGDGVVQWNELAEISKF